MQGSRFWQGMKRVYDRYDRLMEKQGFYVVLAVCVLVIVLSALYTFLLRDEWLTPEVTTVEDAQEAGGSQSAQTLKEAQELVKSRTAEQAMIVPTQAPLRFSQPVKGFTDRLFSDAEPQYFAHIGVWQVHTGIDLLADVGTLVSACAAGTVSEIYEDGSLGLCVRLTHADGYESLYAGLSNADFLRVGDPVAQGQTIAQVGEGVLAERDAQPHLHFELWRNGRPIDPMSAFLGLDN